MGSLKLERSSLGTEPSVATCRVGFELYNFLFLLPVKRWSSPYINRVPKSALLKSTDFFGYNFARFNIWGGARVVEWDSLENYCGLRSTGGSNPPLPAAGLSDFWTGLFPLMVRFI